MPRDRDYRWCKFCHIEMDLKRDQYGEYYVCPRCGFRFRWRFFEKRPTKYYPVIKVKGGKGNE